MSHQQTAAAPSVTIVGAGPSGIATAAFLHHLSIPYTLLEREDCFASLWQKYSYDRVHLHLAKQFCNLPLRPIPHSYPTYVSRSEFVEYLSDYMKHFGIEPRYNTRVERASYDEGAGEWRVTARNVAAAAGEDGLSPGAVEELSSRFLVVATGSTCDAHVPENIEGLEGFKGEVLHSTRYKNGKRFEGKSVLVVGSGNSGMEIACDLADSGARTSIVVRSPVHVISREMASLGLMLFKYLPHGWVDSLVSVMGKIYYRDLTKYGIQRPTEAGPFALKLKYGKYPVIDVGIVAKIKSGEIQVLPCISSINGSNNVVFENGKEYLFDAIVFATGFRNPNKDWVKGDDYLLNDDGFPKPKYPNHWKGKNGLYCCGLARGGLPGSGIDAQNIANDIKALLYN